MENNFRKRLSPTSVNFAHILRAVFCARVFFEAFLRLKFGFVIFGEIILAKKLLVPKMLVKLTNILISSTFFDQFAFSMNLPWSAQASVITLKTQLHAVNAR